MSGRKSSTRTNEEGDDSTDVQIAHKELEVLIAEMETRLRRAVLKIVRPTLDEAADLSARVSEVERKTEQHEHVLAESDKVKEDVSKLAEFMDVMKEQIQTCDQQAREFEGKAAEGLSELRHRMADSEQRLDTTEGELRKIARDFTRVWAETQRLQEQHDEAAQNLWSGINNNARKMEKHRDELLERIAELQKNHYDLVEDIFGDGKGINQVRLDVEVLKVAVEPVPELERQLEAIREQNHELEAKVIKADSKCENIIQKFTSIEASLEERLNEFRADNNASTNKIVAYHASLLRSVRTDFCDEIQASRKMRDGIVDFESKTTEYCKKVSDSLRQEISRVDALFKEIVADLDDVNKCRKKDRGMIENEMRRIERECQAALQTSEASYSSLEHLGKVVALVLESERMTNALHVQDYGDRRAECWLGVPSDANRKPAEACTAQALEKFQSSLARSFASNSMTSLVPIDTKAGLAKLEYKPGPITFANSQFDRKDFILMHYHMLSKAKRLVDSGPPQWPMAQPMRMGQYNQVDIDVSGPIIAAQPSAKGGQGGSEVPGLPKSGSNNGTSDDLRQVTGSSHGNGNGFGQRPGSQHQPQAMGSRGSVTGSLEMRTPRSPRLVGSDMGDLKLPTLNLRRLKQEESERQTTHSLIGGIPFEPLRLGKESKSRALDAVVRSAR